MPKLHHSVRTLTTSLVCAVSLVACATPVVAQSADVGVPVARPEPASTLLMPDDHVLILIDHQPQMAFAVGSHDVDQVRNNVTALAKLSNIFDVPVILTTVAAKSFSGPIFPEIAAVFPNKNPIDRSNMNTWEDSRITDEVNRIGKRKIVIAALWTEVCGIGPVLSALEQGYDVYFVTDASGGVSEEAHDMAVERMVQAGAKPITWMQYGLELQRDWSRQETYVDITSIMKEHGGGYGLGITYAYEMFHSQEGN